MRIDSHQHYWKYIPEDYPWIDDGVPQLKRDILPKDIEETLKKYEIDGVIAVQARQSTIENEFLLSLSMQYPWIKGVIGWVDLRGPKLLSELDKYKDSKIKGFRHLIQDESDPSLFFKDEYFNNGVKTLLGQGYIYEVLFHEKDLKAATLFCQRHDNSTLVIDHLGKPNIKETNPVVWRENVRELAKLPHVYCKLSGLITEADQGWIASDINPFIEIAIELFTPERLLFGSDWPVCDLAGEYSDVYSLIETNIKTLSLPEQAAIMGGNACDIYTIK